MEEAFIAALHVLAGGMLVFFGAVCLAAGLHCGWHLASNVFGPLEFTRNERVTKQIFTYRHGTDREGDAQ